MPDGSNRQGLGEDMYGRFVEHRDQQMHEADIVLERDDGMIVGVDVKAAATVKSGDFAGSHG